MSPRRKNTRRTQPMRVSPKRQQSVALAAAQRGRPAFLQSMGMKRRTAMRKKKRRQSQPRDPLMAILQVRRRGSVRRRGR